MLTKTQQKEADKVTTKRLKETHPKRFKRALEILKDGKISMFEGLDQYKVQSPGSERSYTVNISAMVCSCADYQHREITACKHIIAVWLKVHDYEVESSKSKVQGSKQKPKEGDSVSVLNEEKVEKSNKSSKYQASGRVVAVKLDQDNDRLALLIDNEKEGDKQKEIWFSFWANGNGLPSINKGEEIEFIYHVTQSNGNQWLNIDEIKGTEATKESEDKEEKRNGRMIRSVALKAASRIIANTSADLAGVDELEATIGVAEQFESYLREGA